jgi:hypothetical protein
MKYKDFKHNRRSFCKRSLLATSVIGLGIPLLTGRSKFQKIKSEEFSWSDNKNLYWGDIHNHNSIGQIRGSLERSYDIARSHLDFFCFTPQSLWPDMVELPEGRNTQFIRGFEAARNNWDKMKLLAEKHYEPGRFVPFLGYEVHFNRGDFHIIFPGLDGDIVDLPDIRAWQQYARSHNAILVPHHPGYKPDWRGWDWSLLDTSVSPVVEICSEHGNVESDRSPIRYIRHSMGGRYTKSTLQWLWEQGIQAGVVASTDDHLGFPGAYGEGITGVWSESLSRESVMDAIKQRRTYGVNADRIALQFKLNGHWMGESISNTRSRNISVMVEGEDVIDRVEVLRNNQVIYRDHPVDRIPGRSAWDNPVLSRIEFGWGPWADFDMPRTCDWEFQVMVEGGKILSATSHFQSRPFDEDRRHSVMAGIKESSYKVISYTSRQNAFEDKPTNDVVFKIQGTPETRLTMIMTRPVNMRITKLLGELARANDIQFTGIFSSESVMMHRIVFADNYQSRFQLRDETDNDGTDWYYARVVQWNGSMAWSSPIWVA